MFLSISILEINDTGGGLPWNRLKGISPTSGALSTIELFILGRALRGNFSVF